MAITRRLTLAEFLELPEEKPALELRNGMVSQKMSPKGPHGALQGAFTTWLAGAGEAGRQLRVFPETRINLGGQSFAPDLIAYREDRVPVDEDGYVPDDFFSPGHRHRDRVAGPDAGLLISRCREFVVLDVLVVVLVVPHPRSRRTVYVFQPRGPRVGR